jgi:MOSC domain-containing protein YiiM
MLACAQDDLDQSPDILRAVAEANDMTLGVYARVREPGRIKLGDPVRLA